MGGDHLAEAAAALLLALEVHARESATAPDLCARMEARRAR
jgi:hypothetical protein